MVEVIKNGRPPRSLPLCSILPHKTNLVGLRRDQANEGAHGVGALAQEAVLVVARDLKRKGIGGIGWVFWVGWPSVGAFLGRPPPSRHACHWLPSD